MSTRGDPTGTHHNPRVMEVLAHDEEHLVLRLRGVSTTAANAIRRAILQDVPVLAVDTVYVEENTSHLPDEILAHVLGMLPLSSSTAHGDVERLVRHDECECGVGCTRCTVRLSLSVRCRTRVMQVSTSHITGDVVPHHRDLHLLTLKEGQAVRLTATARKGSGRDHAKWCPAHVTFSRDGRDAVSFSVETTSARAPMELFERGLILSGLLDLVTRNGYHA